MNQALQNTDWISPPSESIMRIAKSSPASFQEFLRSSLESNIDGAGVVENRVKIDTKVAETLSKCLGSTEGFWLKRSSDYEIALSSRAEAISGTLDTSIFEMDILSYFDHEFSKMEYGLNDLEKILHFFAVGTNEELADRYLTFNEDVDFHISKAYSSEKGAIAVWLRAVEQKSQTQFIAAYDANKLRESIILMRSLVKLRKPSMYFNQLKKILNSCGVKLVYLPHPKKCPVSGALIRRPNESPIIAVTFRYLSDDHFWFTFFHEVGHLLDESEDQDTILITDGEHNDRENTADEFAYRTLISEELERSLRAISINKKNVIRLAIKNKISPGILVGQLQHMGRMPMSWMNGLKRRYTRDMLSSILNERP